MKQMALKIEGMGCDGCAHTIQALLEKEPGVKTAAVSFKEAEARILYDPALITEDGVVAIVERPGYRVVPRK